MTHRDILPICQVVDWSKLLINEEYFSGWRLAISC